MMKIGKRIIVFLLAFCLFSGSVAVPSSPVMAQTAIVAPDADVAKTVTFSARIAALISELGILGEIIKVAANIYMMLKEYFGEINEKAENIAHLLVETKKTEAAVSIMLGDAAIDGSASDSLHLATLEALGEYITPKHEYLCKAILMYQLAATTEDFERAVARLALKAIESMHRGPTDDGSGSKYVFEEEKLRCEAKFANIIDGYDAACVETTPPRENERSFADADLLPFSMDGTIALEVPEMTSTATTFSDGSSITVSVPTISQDPEHRYNQRMWLAGLYYCFQLAGPRPSPTWGAENMSRPAGKTERARFEHALAMQSAAIKPCTDLLAYHSRPNKTATALIKEQEKLCSAAEGIIDPVDIEKKFGNCKKGLSPYQAEYLRQLECKSSQSFLANLESGSTHWQGTDDAIICSTSWNNWAAKVAAKQGALVDAVRAIQETKSNWSGIGGKKTSALEEDELASPPV